MPTTSGIVTRDGVLEGEALAVGPGARVLTGDLAGELVGNASRELAGGADGAPVGPAEWSPARETAAEAGGAAELDLDAEAAGVLRPRPRG